MRSCLHLTRPFPSRLATWQESSDAAPKKVRGFAEAFVLQSDPLMAQSGKPEE